MADYLDEFVSTPHLLQLAAGMPAPATNVAPPYQPSLDDYIPPPMPNNVVALPPRQQPTAQTKPQQEAEPVSESELLNELVNIVRAKESSDNYTATNPHSTASGAYQYTDSTWNNYAGYPKAALAPKAVQDRRFREDLMNRLQKYGNPYQVIAAHYLPALAGQPSKWFEPFKVHGKVVKPVIDYVRYVVKDTPLEKGLHEYIAQQQNGV